MSLYGIEKQLGNIIEIPDEVLARIAAELGQLATETEVPRQREEANRLLGQIAFEVGQRYGSTEL